jgi:hypothetical protein
MLTPPPHPTLRGDVLVLAPDRAGSDWGEWSLAAALLLDGTFAGAIEITGRRIFGCSSAPAHPREVALASIMREAGAPKRALGAHPTRRQERMLRRARRELPWSVRVFLDTLAENRRAEEMSGRYAD